MDSRLVRRERQGGDEQELRVQPSMAPLEQGMARGVELDLHDGALVGGDREGRGANRRHRVAPVREPALDPQPQLSAALAGAGSEELEQRTAIAQHGDLLAQQRRTAGAARARSKRQDAASRAPGAPAR